MPAGEAHAKCSIRVLPVPILRHMDLHKSTVRCQVLCWKLCQTCLDRTGLTLWKHLSIFWENLDFSIFSKSNLKHISTNSYNKRARDMFENIWMYFPSIFYHIIMNLDFSTFTSLVESIFQRIPNKRHYKFTRYICNNLNVFSIHI